MKHVIIEQFVRRQPTLDSSLVQEALNGFGMNQHHIPQFAAELAKRIQSARRWGLAAGVSAGVAIVMLLTSIVLVLTHLVGAM